MVRKKTWISTNNIYVYLFYKALLAFVLLLLSQAFFYFDNRLVFFLALRTTIMVAIVGNCSE